MPVKSHKTVILLTLGFLTGISVLLYPVLPTASTPTGFWYAV